MAYAESRAEAERLRHRFADRFQEFSDALACLERDWEALAAFFDFPKEHWKHLRTSDLVESPFASLRLRTDAAKRFKNVSNATMLIWKVLRVSESRWRRLDVPELLRDVYGGKEVRRRQADHASRREGSRLIISTPIDAGSRAASGAGRPRRRTRRAAHDHPGHRPTIFRQRCDEADRDPATLALSAEIWWHGATGQPRIERLEQIAELGLARIHSHFKEAADSDEPLVSFAEDCREAGVELAA